MKFPSHPWSRYLAAGLGALLLAGVGIAADGSVRTASASPPTAP